ncbi:MAG: DUF4282 domain-containing protein [Ginsengibacter sp.]|jgi:uncharacterized membrane protein
MQQEITIQSQLINKGFNWSDFFSFRKMITLQVIQIVYFIVAGLITLGGLIALFSGGGAISQFIPGGAFMGLIFLIFGNILWRIWCELIIVFFRMNNTLSNIDANTKKEILGSGEMKI